ncbi:ABC transporter substrate-binding protein [Paracoccus aestuariivivens]|uniref:Probable sugar-binding periplasmic protein n=1 Tax=Paracoccus aestuariivivens TaxID=1820333 RepID=A0A6L6JA99_9RHOB|nr:ABC transporter substrate-binding protein [Paracoccus aestuariivivens]MTH78095.1 extracellular solute-binding protein [Paracoccus aestuariivivens]
MRIRFLLGATVAVCAAGVAHAEDIEVTHWWTSGSEAAAVAEFAKAFDATGNKWVDGAIAGSGGVARPVMVSRITGGDPMGATQFNHGQQAKELVEAGLMRSLEDVAKADGWRDIVHPASILQSCEIDGEIYCVPVNIHSQLWLWLSNDAFEKAGLKVPTNWEEFVAAAPDLRKAGIQPLVIGQQPWQAALVFQNLVAAIAGPEVYKQVITDKNVDAVNTPEMDKAFAALVTARELATGSNVQEWNQATTMVIKGGAAGQIMGDWAQGEFAIAEQVAGKDYTCLPGLGVSDIVSTGGDAFYFPAIDDPKIAAAQEALARVMISPEAQVAFNLKKGSMPVRSDVDLTAANDCMRKGLDILANGTVVDGLDQALSADASNQLSDLMIQFFNQPDMPVEKVKESLIGILQLSS